MEKITDEKLEKLFNEQHRNTRHDACDVITEIRAEYADKGYNFPEAMFNSMIGKIMNLKIRMPL